MTHSAILVALSSLGRVELIYRLTQQMLSIYSTHWSSNSWGSKQSMGSPMYEYEVMRSANIRIKPATNTSHTCHNRTLAAVIDNRDMWQEHNVLFGQVYYYFQMCIMVPSWSDITNYELRCMSCYGIGIPSYLFSGFEIKWLLKQWHLGEIFHEWWSVKLVST